MLELPQQVRVLVYILGIVTLSDGIAAQSPERVTRFIRQNIGFPSEYNHSLEELRTHVGAQNEHSQQIRNRYDTKQMDRIVILMDGKGLGVQAYVTGLGKVLIERVAINTFQFNLPFGLQLGRSSKLDIRKFFGESGESEQGPNGLQGERFFDHDSAYGNSVLLWFDHNGILTGLEWRYEHE